MNNNRKLGLYISFYLAKYDKLAYERIGFGNQLKTHNKVGDLLGINPYTIKNWRDEFDPFFGHRSGWHDRKPRPAILEIKELLNSKSEEVVFQIVKAVLSEKYNDDLLTSQEKKGKIGLVKENKFGEIINPNGSKTNKDNAIIVAFYLSKFDKKGLHFLGYKNDAEAFKNIADILGVKKNYIKFRRDEFDPIHPWRKGWQRPMDGRIIRTIEALQDLEEPDLREIVLQILKDPIYRTSEEVLEITSLFSEDKDRKAKRGVFILRAPTGKKAEEIFIDYYKKKLLPVDGILSDCRDLGCGYDFKITSKFKDFYFEVKGLSEISGGILFTDKEWKTALEKKKQYYVVIVKNVNAKPLLSIINNPAAKFTPQKKFYTAIQISWGVTEKQLIPIL